MADAFRPLNSEAIEAAARDAATLLLAKDGRWITEAEVVRDLASAGHVQPVARLGLKHLVDTRLVEMKCRYYAPIIEGDTRETARAVKNFSPTPDPPLADGYYCLKPTDALRAWLSASPPAAETEQGHGNGGTAADGAQLLQDAPPPPRDWLEEIKKRTYSKLWLVITGVILLFLLPWCVQIIQMLKTLLEWFGVK